VTQICFIPINIIKLFTSSEGLRRLFQTLVVLRNAIHLFIIKSFRTCLWNRNGCLNFLLQTRIWEII